MTPTPTPAPQPWLVIDGPLVVFPDGAWSVLVSLLALAISAIGLRHTLDARSRVQASVVRSYLQFDKTAHPDGDEVIIANLGRSSAVIYDVRAITNDGSHRNSAQMPRGYDSEPIAFPAMPRTLGPGDVLKVWFSTALAGVTAGAMHGYAISYIDTGGWRRQKRESVLIVKATNAPPPIRG